MCAFISARAWGTVCERTFRMARMRKENRVLSHFSCLRAAARTLSRRTKSKAGDWNLLNSRKNSLVCLSPLAACSSRAPTQLTSAFMFRVTWGNTFSC